MPRGSVEHLRKADPARRMARCLEIKAAARQPIKIESIDGLEFRTRPVRGYWTPFLGELMELRAGEALALPVEKIPNGLKKAAEAIGEVLEFAPTPTGIAVRVKVKE